MLKNNPEINPEAARQIAQLERYAKLMDSKFRIPGTSVRFGFDPILGLIPFAGDAVSLVFQGAILVSILKHGVSGKVMVLMVLNLIIDFIVGSIPLFGNIFDFFYHSSDKNINLLKKHYGEGRYKGSGIGIILLILLVVVIIALGIGFLIFKLISYIAGMF